MTADNYSFSKPIFCLVFLASISIFSRIIISTVIWRVCCGTGEAVVVSYGVWFVILHLFGLGPDHAAFAQAGYSPVGGLRALRPSNSPYVLVAPA